MIETASLPAMVEACDAATKAAEVRVVAIEQVGCALLTCFIRGDVAAVKAAVDAGCAAATRVGQLIGSHVIPRPHPALDAVFPISGPTRPDADPRSFVSCSC
ncbi:MAG: ethanolamine utilization protein EutM [bacterium]|nr:MAG: ethanolamine utilization protein EutM [bacterium]